MRQIKLVDEWGNEEYVRQRGRMSITKHSRVLSALEKRATRYRNRNVNEADPDERLYREAIDETGTVATAALTDSDDESMSSAEKVSPRRFLDSNICEDLLKIHDIAPGKKPDGVTRYVMENMNGMPNYINGNETLE